MGLFGWDKKKDKKELGRDPKKVAKEREWDDLEEQDKFVNEKGKVKCQFCSEPIGGLKVTSNKISLQDAPYVTIADKDGKVNLDFKGNCLASPGTNKPPCKSVISLASWQNYSDTKINNDNALLVKSTIKCTYGNIDIKIVDSGQITILEEIEPMPPLVLKIIKIDTKYFLPKGIINPLKPSDDFSNVIKVIFEVKEQPLKNSKISFYDSKGELIFRHLSKPDKEYTTGKHEYEWDGFDATEIYDSARLSDGITVEITGSGDVGTAKASKEIKTAYKHEKWVDMKMYRNISKIDLTLRFQLKDKEDIKSPAKVPADVRRIYGQSSINFGGRTRSPSQLQDLFVEGVEQYWSRTILVNGKSYIVKTSGYNASKNSMDTLNLIYRSNASWGRSSNPNTVTGPISLIANVVPQRVYYNVGYIEFSNGWAFVSDSNADEEFKHTGAHEMGHEILKAIGGSIYSYQHKDTSGLIIQSPKKGTRYPSTGEIDLMKYAEGGAFDYGRSVAAENDVMGLIWLTKIEIK